MTIDPQSAIAWEYRIEHEVDRNHGGMATIGQVIDILSRLGWQPPAEIPPIPQA